MSASLQFKAVFRWECLLKETERPLRASLCGPGLGCVCVCACATSCCSGAHSNMLNSNSNKLLSSSEAVLQGKVLAQSCLLKARNAFFI